MPTEPTPPKGYRMWIDAKDPSTWVLDTEGRIMLYLDKSGEYHHLVQKNPDHRPFPAGYNHKAARRRRFWDRVCWWLMDVAALLSWWTWTCQHYETRKQSVPIGFDLDTGRDICEWVPYKAKDGWRPERYV